MPRFEADEPTWAVGSPTTTLHDTPDGGPGPNDEEASRPTRNKWYQTRKTSGDKVKKAEKVEDVDYVEEVDGVWGKLGEGAPNYKNVGW